MKTETRFGHEVLATDFSQPWTRGLEYIEQEGTPAWQEIRERHGLTPEQVELLSESQVMWEEVHMLEDRPGLPTLQQLEFYARLEGTSPGALLDGVLEAKGRELMGDDFE